MGIGNDDDKSAIVLKAELLIKYFTILSPLYLHTQDCVSNFAASCLFD